MADISDKNIQQIRQVVREEISGLEGDTSTLKSDVSSFKTDFSSMLGEQQRQGTLLENLQKGVREQGVLLENLDSEFKAVAESISNNLKVKSQVDDHGDRITKLETGNKLVKSTMAFHSKQIKSLQPG